MARIIYPSDYLSQRKLFNDMVEKHLADGTNSALTAMLAENNINIDSDRTNATQADRHEVQRDKHSRTAENFEQAANNTMKPLVANVRGIGQFFKKHYRSNIQKLGDWGFTVNGNRIVIPTTPDELKILIDAIKAKHDSYILPLEPSPLYVFLAENIGTHPTQMAMAAQQAVADNDAAQVERQQKEIGKQQRDNLWLPVMAHVRIIGSFLTELLPGKEKRAGDWGFPVDDSARKPKVVTIKLLLDSKKTVTAIVLGGTLTNIGSILLHVYKGKTTTGTPIVVNPAEKLGMTKGFSAITVLNPNTLVAGKFTVLKHQ